MDVWLVGLVSRENECLKSGRERRAGGREGKRKEKKEGEKGEEGGKMNSD